MEGAVSTGAGHWFDPSSVQNRKPTKHPPATEACYGRGVDAQDVGILTVADEALLRYRSEH